MQARSFKVWKSDGKTKVLILWQGQSLYREMLQGKPYEERQTIVNTKRLCYLCLEKGNIASNCKNGPGCFVPGCGKRHHPMLHPVEERKT